MYTTPEFFELKFDSSSTVPTCEMRDVLDLRRGQDPQIRSTGPRVNILLTMPHQSRIIDVLGYPKHSSSRVH